MPKRWLVLVGGGGCGRWQAGALEALNAAGVLKGLDGVVGTSVGGINACLLGSGFATGSGITPLVSAWQGIRCNADIYKPDLFNAITSPWQHVTDWFGLARGFIWGPAPCSTDPLAALAHKLLGGHNTDEVEKMAGVKVRVRAYNYATNQADTLKGDLDALALATSAIEGIFPERYGYGDGGAADNEPLDVALSNGARQVMVVYCGPAASEPASNTDVPITTATPSPTSTGLANALAVIDGITKANEDLVEDAAEDAEAHGVQVIHCYPTSTTGSALDFSERGLYARGLAEAAPAIAQAKTLGWI